MDNDAIGRIADLLAARNDIDREIAAIIHRPMTSGHLGEWIAEQVFDIALEESATAPGIDGHFRSGPLAGKSVNVKWYLKDEGLLDIATSAADFYLVLAGPRSAALSSKGSHRPWTIKTVYLLDTTVLMHELETTAVKVGVATSVRHPIWAASQIYPTSTNQDLPLSKGQQVMLSQLAL